MAVVGVRSLKPPRDGRSYGVLEGDSMFADYSQKEPRRRQRRHTASSSGFNLASDAHSLVGAVMVRIWAEN
jgi:hypothetical protein